jgi:ABC-2 type transport system ATP-binding protein
MDQAQPKQTAARKTESPRADDGHKTVVLKAQNLARTFGRTKAVAGLSLHIKKGELYGLVGPDGAGKTTTIRMLAGLMDPDAGQASVLGRPARKGGRVREAVGYMPQLYSLYGDLSVDENLRFFGRLFALKKHDFARRRNRLLAITRLERFSNRRAANLSGGMYKKLALACALLHQPQILLLDEPTNGVDPVSRRELWELLYEFVSGSMAVLVTTPYMDEAEKCHRVGLIHRGRLLAEDAPGNLIRSFREKVYLVHPLQRNAFEERLENKSDVLGITPHGQSLKVVVARSAAAAFESWLENQKTKASTETVAPNFEDVFLTRIAGARQKQKNAKRTNAPAQPGPQETRT